MQASPLFLAWVKGLYGLPRREMYLSRDMSRSTFLMPNCKKWIIRCNKRKMQCFVIEA